MLELLGLSTAGSYHLEAWMCEGRLRCYPNPARTVASRGHLKGVVTIGRGTKSLPVVWQGGSGEEPPEPLSSSALQIPSDASHWLNHLTAGGQRSTGAVDLRGHPPRVQNWAEKGGVELERQLEYTQHGPSILFFHLNENNSKQNKGNKKSYEFLYDSGICQCNQILTWSQTVILTTSGVIFTWVLFHTKRKEK